MRSEGRRLSHFDASVDHLKSRHKTIQEMEDVTTTLQSMWRDERQQIEDSWSYKMDDLRSLQVRCKEVEHLQLTIDEFSAKVVRLREELDETHSVLQSQRSLTASIPARLNRLYEIHPKLEAKVAAILAKKKIVDHQARVLEERCLRVDTLQAEVDRLEGEVNQRSGLLEMESVGKQSAAKTVPRTSASLHVQFPTPDDFSGTDVQGEEEEAAEFTQHSPEFETRTPDDSSDHEEDRDDILEQVIREAQDAIAMPLLRSQFWVD
jgi:DNA repair ATPase RecN